MSEVCAKCGCNTIRNFLKTAPTGELVEKTKCSECDHEIFVDSKQYNGPKYTSVYVDDNPRYCARSGRNAQRTYPSVGSWIEEDEH